MMRTRGRAIVLGNPKLSMARRLGCLRRAIAIVFVVAMMTMHGAPVAAVDFSSPYPTRQRLVAAAHAAMFTPDQYREYIRGDYLNSLYDRTPNLPRSEARRLMQAFDSDFEKARKELGYQDKLNDLQLERLRIKVTTEVLSGYLPDRWAGNYKGAAEWALWENEQAVDALREQLGKARADDFLSRIRAVVPVLDRQRLQRTLDWARDCARNQEYCDAHTELITPKTGVRLDATIDELIALHPELAILKEIAELQGSVADVSLKLEQYAKELNKSITAQLTAAIEEMRVIHGESEKEADPSPLEAEALAKAKAEKAKAVEFGLAGLRAATYLISSMIEIVDPRLGRAVDAFGNGVIGIAQAIYTYTDQLKEYRILGARLGEMLDIGTTVASDLGQAIGAAIMTGQIVGAFLSIVNAIAGLNGPSIEEVILEEVRQVGQSLATMHTQMHDRFDRIDKALNDAYSVLIGGFARLERSIQGLLVNVTQLRNDLSRTEVSLRRLEENMYDAFLDEAGREYWHTLGVISETSRTGDPLAYDRYVDYVVLFEDWATKVSRGTAATGGADPPVDDEDVRLQLATRKDRGINYLADFVESRWPDLGSFRAAGSRLPSPQQWVLGARGLTLTLSAWPEHGARLTPDRIDEVLADGEEIANAFRSLATNRPLVQRLFDNYQDKLGTAREWAALQSRLEPVDPFAGAYQAVASLPGDIEFALMPPCDREGPKLPAPAAPIVPEPFAVARELNGSLEPARRNAGMKVCYTAAWRMTREYLVPEYPSYRCRDYSVDVSVSFRWFGLPVRTRSISSPYLNQFCVVARLGDPVSIDEHFKRNLAAIDLYRAVANRWQLAPDSWQDAMATRATVADDNVAIAQYAEELEVQLRESKRDVYAAIAREAARGPESSPIKQLAGAKRLLEVAITAGYPTAVEEDDTLRLLLLGRNSIVDDLALSVSFAAAATGDLEGDARDVVFADGLRRVRQLSDAILGPLCLIPQQPTPSPSPSPPAIAQPLLVPPTEPEDCPKGYVDLANSDARWSQHWMLESALTETRLARELMAPPGAVFGDVVGRFLE